jgi:putative transposase
MIKRLKGRSARILMEEFGELRKRYWGGHFWGIGYGAWSTGNITDEMIQEYLEHHKEGPNSDQNFILE